MPKCAEFEYSFEPDDDGFGTLVLRIPLNQNRTRPSISTRTFLIASSQGRKFVQDNNGVERPERFSFSVYLPRKKTADSDGYEE